MPLRSTFVRFAGGEDIEFELDPRFRVVEPLGKFNSAVAVVEDSVTGQTLVAKKLARPVERCQAARLVVELRLARLLAHDNVAPLQHVSVAADAEGKLKAMYMLYTHAEVDLHRLIRHPQQLTGPHVVVIGYQLLKALAHLHAHNVLHRDVKPSNVLLSADFQVWLTDFGLARALPDGGAAMSDYVCTRWYRAPELLMGASTYGAAVDIWAAGCAIFECVARRVLFQGNGHLDQLRRITQTVGKVPRGEWQGLGTKSAAEDFVSSLPTPRHPPDWEELAPAASADLALLLRALLQASPAGRPTAVEAMRMSVFRDVYDASDEPVVDSTVAAALKERCAFVTVPELEESIAEIEREVADAAGGTTPEAPSSSPAAGSPRMPQHLHPTPAGCSCCT